MKPVFVTTFIFFMIIPITGASPLFEETFARPLVVELETDLHRIKNEKHDFDTSTNNYVNGRFRIRGMAFDVRLQTRGHNRLDRCPFPPLKVYFDKSEIKNSLFKYNHKLKLVTHCQEDELNLLFREHLIYKIYNSITPYSFRVCLLKIKYIDIDGREDPMETYAFFIESDRSIEKRLNLDKLQSDQDFNMKTHNDIAPEWPNTSQSKLQEAFQHLIRNNDWVIFHSGSPMTLSLANVNFFHNEKEGFPFPYDFDIAGVVIWNDDSYKNRYGIDNLCKNDDTKAAFMKILSHKEEYHQVLKNHTYLSTAYKNKFSAYLNQFKTVDDFCLESNFDSTFFL